MVFLYETKKDGIISVEANVVDGELEVRLNVKLNKRDQQDVFNVAKVALAYEMQYGNEQVKEASK